MTSAPLSIGPTRRLRSLDALRGFDMLWITGGSGVLFAWASTTDSTLVDRLAEQCTHVEWNGFRLWDLVFPLFLFVSGVSLPFSLEKRIERGDGPVRLHLHALRRGFLLALLGLIYNGLLRFDGELLRWPSVLGRIGLAWMGAALISLHTGLRGRTAWAIGLLLGYWAAMSWIPVPGFGAGDLQPGHTLADYLDRLLLPGRLHRMVRDPEGILATLPAISTALSGVLAGHWLRSHRHSDHRKVLGLALAGLACLGIGAIWHQVFPINKNLWSSSFVLWTSGLSLILLSVFYLVIDVWGFHRWSFFFVVIGTNALTIYFLQRFIDFEGIVATVFAVSAGRLHPVLFAGLGIALRWVLLLWMYRRRIFLRI